MAYDTISSERFAEALATVRRYFAPTPVLSAPQLSMALGAAVDLKLETATPIRAFKLRGALCKLDALAKSGESLESGVITASAGNHGLAVARAARLNGRSAVICVPENANAHKVQLIKAEGARVVQKGINYAAAYEHCLALAEAEHRQLVHAYNDPDVIAGQGTIGLELLDQGEYDAVIAGVGGGGLVSGLAAAIKQRSPKTRIIGVEPTGADAMTRSLAAGSIIKLDQVTTFADGLAASRPGEWTFGLTRRYVDDLWTVTDEEILEAMAFLLKEERQVVEPAGATAVAGLLKHGAPGRRVAVVLSGAHIADAVFAQVLAKCQ